MLLSMCADAWRGWAAVFERCGSWALGACASVGAVHVSKVRHLHIIHESMCHGMINLMVYQ